ncbi:amidohydrolase/deacetylase family metallohydrolase [Bacillaceae bacterium Marseille-Q3522]|nr:amidohydrolase/deacetylase family metallohydrolase [Bacillaceae bacterium Marseille-Q3522]
MSQPILVNVVDPEKREIYPGSLRLTENRYYLERVQESEAKTDLYLSPGWIDMHVHVFDGVTPIGIHADSIGLQTGVHLLADAGSSGEATLNGFIKYIIPAFKTPIRAWLNISSIGLVHTRECSNISYFDVEKTIQAIKKHQPFICGVKVRSEKEIVGSLGIQPLKLAAAVARNVRLPLMVHIGEPPPNIEDILELLEEGDVITHCFHGKTFHPWLPTGEPIPALKKALERGVLIDVGHGYKSFSFDVSAKAIASGHSPFSISTDAHARNIHGPVYDLPTTMTKMLACGMNLLDVITAVTKAPAKVLKLKEWSLLDGFIQHATLFKVTGQPAVQRKIEDANGKEIFPASFIVPAAVITQEGIQWLEKDRAILSGKMGI